MLPRQTGTGVRAIAGCGTARGASSRPFKCIAAIAPSLHSPVRIATWRQVSVDPMTSLENFGYRQELKRTLSIRDLVVYGMVLFVPISPFGVFGFVWRDAKGMVPLAYLVGLIGMFFTAMSYASMSRAFPMAGSVYSYVGRRLHETDVFFAR